MVLDCFTLEMGPIGRPQNFPKSAKALFRIMVAHGVFADLYALNWVCCSLYPSFVRRKRGCKAEANIFIADPSSYP